MKRFLCVLIISGFSISLLASPDGEELSIKAKAKVEVAKQKMYNGQYREALALFKDVLNESPNNSHVLYYAADCSNKLGDTKAAQEYLEKGKTAPAPKVETYYLLGTIYQAQGETDKALNEFSAYKSKATPAELKENSPEVNISQCNNAKRMMASPVNVKIENLGDHVNSKYDDKGPAITADGRKLFFNTRRPETTDAPVDVEGDGKYFEEIYYTGWDTVKMQWIPAEEIPGQINQTGAHTACTGISPDGKQIFIYKNDMTNPEARGGDIFVAKVVNNKWKSAAPLGKPVNTSYWEGGACISPDGKTLFFTSERKGGVGHSDIWMATRKSKTEWNEPVNLGTDVNTEFDEAGLFLAPDGKTLFFCNNGPNSMGSYDIFRTVNENGKWSKPENLGYPINSVKRDGPLVLAANAQYAYFSTDRVGGFGENDIYRIDLKEYAILEKDFKKSSVALSILKGNVKDKDGRGIDGAEIFITNDAGVKTNVATDENGDYMITLKGGAAYQLKISKKGYKDAEEKINLPHSQTADTFTMEKQITLEK